MYSFNFLGKDSYLDYGILVEKRPPIPKPQRNVDYIEVPGRSGSLKVDDETYNDVLIPIKCGFLNEDVVSKADEVKTWLDGGEGRLILSNQTDKYYMAHVSDQFDISQEWRVFGQFLVNFRCKPFKYSVINDAVTMLAPGNITNPGTVKSEPIIVLTGTGNITLTINGVSIQLNNVNGYITIDSVLKDAYKETLLQNNLMLGDFPVLVPGDNEISWTGNVTSVQITPNWRWL